MLFKKQHTLVIPSSHSRRLYNESELPYLSETIIRKGNTSSLHFDTDMPHTSMFVLPEPPSSSTEMKTVIEWSSRTSTKDVEPWKTTVAFSSLSLLRTICDCSKYKMEVVCCIDGTHGIMCNDYKLLIFGVLDFIRNPKKGKKKYQDNLSHYFSSLQREKQCSQLYLLFHLLNTLSIIFLG